MKHERLLTMAVSAALSFVTALGAAGCLVSAFNLPLEHPWSLLPVTAATSLLCSAALVFHRGGTVLACLAALVWGYIYHDGRAAEQLCQLVYQLSAVYDRAYSWGVLILSENAQNTAFFDWPVGILGAGTAMAASFCVCRQKSVWLPVMVSLVSVAPCIVVTDTVPSEICLLLLLTGLTILLLTTSVRQENSAQGLQLAMGTALPVVVGLIALFLAVPQNGYVNRSVQIQERIRAATQKIPTVMEAGMNQLASRFQQDAPTRVDLAGLGPRLAFTYAVMDVTAESGGTLYLRGRDYDSYDGLGWIATKQRQEPFSRIDGPSEAVTIHTASRKDQLFLPYYPQEELLLAAGRADNTGDALEYTFTRNTLPENWRQLAYQPAVYGNDKWPQYCGLPENTRREAEALLSGRFSDGASNTEKADIIAALVTDTADYDQNPEKMPGEEEDFALWFLREADSGYCVHFATAATVLLRAADVPARYVTGYMLEARAGETVTVTEEQSHAWAEYFEPNLNVWIPLEVTPGTATEVPVTETQPPETMAPPETESVTEATIPEQTESLPPEPEPSSALPEEPAAPQPPASGGLGIRTLLRTLMKLLLTAAALSLIPIQRTLRIRLRRRNQRRRSTNWQALRRWQETERLCRLLKTEAPDHLLQLAQKAKFSQYEIAPEELQLFDGFRRSCQKQLREKPLYIRWVYKYLFAAY